jgi:hypothetical protein
MENAVFPFVSFLTLVPCGLFSFFYIIIMLFVLVFGVGMTVFWVWTLVDVIQRDDKDFPNKGKDQKLIWLLVIILGQVVGSAIYYLMVMRSPAKK